MKHFTLIIVLIIVIIGIFIFNKNRTHAPVVVEDSAIGCYVATTGEDVYSLNVTSQDGDAVAGKLVFDNFQKDSSQGTFAGTYTDGILLGSYSFQSEGMDSVSRIAFKKVGNDFVRGYGEMNATGDDFADVNALTYNATDTLALFKASAEPCQSAL